MAEGPMPPEPYGDPVTSVSGVVLSPMANIRRPPGLLPLTATVSPTYRIWRETSTATVVSPPVVFLGAYVFPALKGFPDAAELNGIAASPVVPMATNT